MEWVEVRGASMAPFLTPGDQVGLEWIGAAEAARLRAGEVVLARDDDGEWIVHRVIAKGRSKGDAAFAWDGFAEEQLWARAVALRPRGTSRVVTIRTDWRDRALALLSSWTMSPRTLHAAAARRALRVLARWRRRSLLKG